MIERFSDRHGYQPTAVEISVREDAPDYLREAIPSLAFSVGMDSTAMRQTICEVLLKQPDPGNWSDDNVRGEIYWLLGNTLWHKVYDIVEVLYEKIVKNSEWLNDDAADEFERRLNELFVENGIGWELRNGKITHRGSEAFDKITREVPDRLDESGFQRAKEQLREALKGISRRPEPDITGAIDHAMKGLEAIAREVTGQPKPTLGKLVPLLDLPVPLDQAVSKLWGFASERSRHIREQQQAPNLAEAELIIFVSHALCDFIVKRRF